MTLNSLFLYYWKELSMLSLCIGFVWLFCSIGVLEIVLIQWLSQIRARGFSYYCIGIKGDLFHCNVLSHFLFCKHRDMSMVIKMWIVLWIKFFTFLCCVSYYIKFIKRITNVHINGMFNKKLKYIWCWLQIASPPCLNYH